MTRPPSQPLSPFDRTGESTENAAQLADVASRDPLTGLLSRGGLFAAIAHEDPSRGFVGALLVKVARFKRINDLGGERYGDRCLIEVASWLRSILDPSDVLARMSGNQFLVLFTWRSTVVDEVRDGGSRLLQVGTKQIDVAIVGGWARRLPGQDLDQVVRNAETALAVAKARPARTLVLADDLMCAAAADRLSAEEIVRSAVLERGLTAHFQPVVNVALSAVESVEALARLRIADASLPAERIVGLGYELGLEIPLAEQIFELAFQGAALMSAVWPDIKVAVNVSRDLLGSGRALQMVSESAAAANIASSRVIVEITEETAAAVTGAVLRNALSGGVAAGISVVIDDFGTGETSLALLRELPLGGIKLDRSLIPGEADSEGWFFLDAVISALSVLTPRLVAEGVETLNQSRRLLDLGVAVQQGYLFGRAQDYRHWLTHQVFMPPNAADA